MRVIAFILDPAVARSPAVPAAARAARPRSAARLRRLRSLTRKAVPWRVRCRSRWGGCVCGGGWPRRLHTLAVPPEASTVGRAAG